MTILTSEGSLVRTQLRPPAKTLHGRPGFWADGSAPIADNDYAGECSTVGLRRVCEGQPRFGAVLRQLMGAQMGADSA